MSRNKTGTVPSYRHHKARNLAVVTIDGHDYYLGAYGSPDSHRRYEALVRSWRERQDNPEPSANQLLVPNDRSSINELILIYLKFVQHHYKLNHGRNKEAGCVSDAVAVIQECGYGPEPADAFRPKDLKKVRDAMIAKTWSRGYVNHQIIRIKRMFAYAVEEDMVPGSVYHALLAIKGLRKGTPGVREAGKVKPVPIDDVKAVMKKANKMLKAMLLFAWYTGARPGEVCALKPCYLNIDAKVWTFHVPPDANKTDVHDQERTIYVGPKTQKVLKAWLKEILPDEHVFSPIREEQLRQAERAAARKTKPTPSEIRRKGERKNCIRKLRKRDHYDPNAFRQAVVRLCDAAGVSRWSPNRLRHNAGTRFRRKYGIEVARILLGHSRVPDGWYSSREAWARFVDRLTDAAQPSPRQEFVPPAKSAPRQQHIEDEINAVRASIGRKPPMLREGTVAPTPSSGPKPRWNADRAELWLGDHLCKRFRQPAKNQRLVLDAFEKQGWPSRIKR